MNAAEARRKKFAALIHRGLTATKAARECGYKNPQQAGWRLSKNVEVCNEIARLQAQTEQKLGERAVEAALTADEILAELARIVRDPEAKMADKLRAIQLAGSNLAMWIEKHDVTTTSVEKSVQQATEGRIVKLKLCGKSTAKPENQQKTA